jgi:[citrate (pro-3S)-lyase] ligase
MYPMFSDLYNDIPYFSTAYLDEITTSPLMISTEKGHVFTDKFSRYSNFRNGMRVVVDQPKCFDNTIHLFGPCYIIGIYHEDKLTVASQLQKILLAEPLHNKIWRVQNHGFLKHLESPNFTNVITTDIHPGDICIVFDSSPKDCLPFCVANKLAQDQVQDVSWAFDRPHDYGEIFFESSHFSHRGATLLAQAVQKILVNHNWHTHGSDSKKIGSQDSNQNQLPKSKLLDKYLGAYISYLMAEKTMSTGKKGCIVMNCNPFTLGHKYLIEQAATRVDWLYIFCVEEDKSFFSFEERFSLLQQGTKDLANVKMLKSGNLIISHLTFPDYFLRSGVTKTKGKVYSISTLDIDIFCEHIAPVLDISTRFAGTEPTDPLTNSYNQLMREKLPKSGIDFIEIERLTIENKPINASTVRKLMNEGNLDALASLVPPDTLAFIKNRLFGYISG